MVMRLTERMKVLTLAGSLAIGSLVLPFSIRSAEASKNWQARDGIYGEIKFAEFCNNGNSSRLRVIAEAGSQDSRVQNVEFKMYSRYAIGVTIFNTPIIVKTSEAWRGIGASPYGRQQATTNTPTGDRRWYRIDWPVIPLISSSENTPIKFAIHVNHSKGKTIDLGGIVDLGAIPYGKCRIYDDGNYRDG